MRSTTTKLSISGLSAPVHVGDRLTISGVQNTVTAIKGSEVEISESWEVRRRRPPKLIAHKERGHSWWPVRETTPRHYRCSKCESTKEPGGAAFESCKEAIVRAVYNR